MSQAFLGTRSGGVAVHGRIDRDERGDSGLLLGRSRDVKPIGEILVTNGWIESSILQRALVKQRESGQRLCSLLVINGALEADEAACALAEQHGVAAALQRHLKGRDRSLAELLSAALARACVALPIGRMGTGEIIVCVRDPSPALATQLARAMKESIRLAVAPAHQLEELVLETYGADDANEFDVDLSTGPIMSLELDEDQIEAMSADSMADLGSLELVDLDDTGVSKDASQNQPPIGKQRASTLPPANVTVDAPSHRSALPIVVDAPSSRSVAAIVVDAPSQRVPPGRAALAAGGPTIARTRTPPLVADEIELPPAIGRTPTPRPQPIDDLPTPPAPDSPPAITPGLARPPGAPPPALAALQRASLVASRTMTPPSRDPVTARPIPRVIPKPPPQIAVGTESHGAPVPDDIALGTQLPTASFAVSARLAEALAAVAAAPTPDATRDALLSFAAQRWSAVLLLDIEDTIATGRRGHGAELSDDLAQWVILPLNQPSLLQAALETSGAATVTPQGHGDVEKRLQKLLGMARAPSAIAIIVDGKPACLLAVGDPDGDDLKTAAADLERLARAAGDTLTQLHGR